MTLTANPSVVLVEPGQNTAPSILEWRYIFRIDLFTRYFGVGQNPPQFLQSNLNESMRMKGRTTIQLERGQIFEALTLPASDQSIDGYTPEELNFFATDRIVIEGLGDRSALIADHTESDVGGTYFGMTIATPVADTVALVEIGRVPDRPENGILVLPDPMMTIRAADPSRLHQLITDELLPYLSESDQLQPGQKYYVLARVWDSAGRWQQLAFPILTKLRELTIDLHTIDVQSIGEVSTDQTGEMRFRLSVWDRSSSPWRTVKSFEFEDHSVRLQPFAVRNHVRDHTVNLPPGARLNGTASIVLQVTEFDAWPNPDDLAESLLFGRPIHLINVTPGRLNENRPLDIIVRAAGPDTFWDIEAPVIVDLRAHVTVSHVDQPPVM